MTFRNKPNRDTAHPVPDNEWPFPDDLDDYERELEASIARGEWQQVDNHEAELNRYQEMARIARATGKCGPAPDEVGTNPAAETAATLFANRKNLTTLGNYSEEDTVSHLIDPALAFLGYPVTHQRRELQSGGNRPDIILWDAPTALAGARPATAVLEAKPLGHDLEGKGKPRAQRPKNQQRRYMTGHPASQPGTYGFLTDGNIWHTVRRNENDRIELVNEWRLLDETPAACARYLQEIKAILDGAAPSPAPATPSGNLKEARAICRAIADGAAPAAILQLLAGQTGRSSIRDTVRLSSKADQAEQDYWRQYAYAEAGRIRVEQGDTAHEAVCAAVVLATDAADESDTVLHRDDVAIAAAAFARAVATKMSVLLMIQPDENGEPAATRLAVRYQGHTGMTAEFNPHTPAPRTLRTLQRIYDQLNKKTAVMANTLVEAVAARGVRREFYEKIANGWTLRQYRKARGNASRQQAYREAVLRHLIRTVFAWILKEDGKLPPEAFDEAFARREAAGKYHGDVLTFLFHERLNQPAGSRPAHQNPAIDRALTGARFLNGSLFARHQDDGLLALTDADYFGTDPKEPGLFAILSEYDWTAAEHTPHSSDQTIDPEVLSNLFENLVAVTRHGGATPDRMPAGTYYTPADVAQEMVQDALTEAVIGHAPAAYTRAHLRALFGAADERPPATTDLERNRLLARIRALTIYDPAVGSGEFPFLGTLAIRGALGKLGVTDDGGAVTRDIVARQLFAQDINPMAVQVARLRLFIAIIAAENSAPDTDAGAGIPPPPLPNLEAKIVCADTLATVADPDWSPFGAGTLQERVAEVNHALAQVASIREQWQSAHDEPAKAALRQQDETARRALRRALPGRMANPETAAFAEHPLLDPDAPPAQTDPRLLFYHPDRPGFDIVIGNPPYESVNKDLQAPPNAGKPAQRELNRQRQARRRHLTDQKRYRTTAGNDLYNLIAEAGLALAKPDGGVVTLVVPLSLCFGQDQHDLRRLFEERCRRISLRCQDIRPDKTFHDSPVAHRENAQRTTILTAVTGAGTPAIAITGANKWNKSERHEYLTSRPRAVTRRPETPVDQRIDSQWERIPTPEIQDLLSAMRASPTKIRDFRHTGENESALAFPPTARYFITATPSGRLNRGENLLPIGSAAHLELAIAAANTHAAYAWWKAFGDAFHINPHELATLAIPQDWLDDAETHRRARRLAQELLAAIKPANIKPLTTGARGKVQDSLNFHECAPDVIAQLDALYLDALAQPRQPLLPQLHTLRRDSAWRLAAAP